MAQFSQPSSPAPFPLHVDLSGIHEFLGQDAALIDEILQLFIAPARATLADLAAACRLRNPEAVRNAAHKLLSAARTIGAGPLGDLCLEMELNAAGGEWAVLEELLADIEAELAAVLTFIEPVIANLPFEGAVEFASH